MVSNNQPPLSSGSDCGVGWLLNINPKLPYVFHLTVVITNTSVHVQVFIVTSMNYYLHTTTHISHNTVWQCSVM